jgi:hypothetical protein
MLAYNGLVISEGRDPAFLKMNKDVLFTIYSAAS